MSKRKQARIQARKETARRVYEFIREFKKAEYGLSPSFEEIAEACFMSRSSVLHYLDWLEAWGKITRTPGMPRSIALIDEDKPF